MKDQPSARRSAGRLDPAALLAEVQGAAQTLFLPWRPGRKVRVLRLPGLSLTAAEELALRGLRGPVRLEVPPEACLQREISLPRAARAKAAQAIALHLRASLPAEARGLIWRPVLQRRSGPGLSYICYILKEAQLTELRRAAQAAGARLVEIRLAGVQAPPLWQAASHRPDAARTWAVGTLLSCLLAGLAVIAVTEAERAGLRDQLDTRASLVARLEQRLRDLQDSDAKGEAEGILRAAQLEDFHNGLRPLAGLGQVAAILPEGVWISELSVAGAGWRLSGFASGEVSDTVQALQALPGAENVRLSGPVMFDTFSQQNRFDIEFTLRPGAEE